MPGADPEAAPDPEIDVDHETDIEPESRDCIDKILKKTPKIKLKVWIL